MLIENFLKDGPNSLVHPAVRSIVKHILNLVQPEYDAVISLMHLFHKNNFRIQCDLKASRICVLKQGLSLFSMKQV
jgi:hypothetical protein